MKSLLINQNELKLPISYPPSSVCAIPINLFLKHQSFPSKHSHFHNFPYLFLNVGCVLVSSSPSKSLYRSSINKWCSHAIYFDGLSTLFIKFITRTITQPCCLTSSLQFSFIVFYVSHRFTHLIQSINQPFYFDFRIFDFFGSNFGLILAELTLDKL